ncbi:MAG: hypothetical protein U9R32_01455, partial [Bacteroidota bacterium]|nr:hypothetical protein [Bacteroidota bacterium]
MRKFTRIKMLLMASIFMISSVSLFAQDREITGSIVTDNGYLQGETMDVEFVLDFDSPDAEWAEEITVTFPGGIVVNEAPNITGGSNELELNSIEGQIVHWGPDGYLSSTNSPISFTVNVDVPADAAGAFDVAYEVIGDQYGDEPHSFSGVATWELETIFTPINFIAELNSNSTVDDIKIDLTWENNALANAENIEKHYIYRGLTADDVELIDSTEVLTYTDETVVDEHTYFYQVSALFTDGESDRTEVAEVTAYDEAIFAITPESHSFGTVGLLDGAVFYGVDNAEFTVSNTGVGSFNVVEEPYFFSGNNDQFAIAENTTEYPYEVAETALNFEVEFNPTTAGPKNTLLVVK